MDEVFARRDVLKSQTLKRLCVTSDWRGALQLSSHVGAIFLTGWWLAQSMGSFWVVPAFMLHGTLINFLYAGQHELSHWTVFRTRGLNEFFGRILGFVLFYPRTFDLVQHVAHHRFTQDWQRDGELARERYTLKSYLLWFSGITYWYTRWRRIIRFSFGIVTEPYLPASRKADFVLEARLHLAGYVLIAVLSAWFNTGAAVTFWLAPMLVMKFMQQLQNTIEHLGLPHSDNVLQNTRSTRTNAFMRWMGWQMQYHTAHHAFPGVPFHRLAELDQEIFAQRGSQPPSMTYWGFQWAVVKAFWAGKTEKDYPDDQTWIHDQSDA